jgi:hypothetical protein
MSQFIELLLFEFARRPPKDDLQEECLAAEEAILKFRTTGEGTPGLVPHLESTAITGADVAALTTALKSFVLSSPAHPSIGSAIWALSKLNDDALAPFFLDQIRLHHAGKRLHPVQQADYALGRLGHDIPEYDYSPGETTHDGYWAAVEIFLERYPQT